MEGCERLDDVPRPGPQARNAEYEQTPARPQTVGSHDDSPRFVFHRGLGEKAASAWTTTVRESAAEEHQPYRLHFPAVLQGLRARMYLATSGAALRAPARLGAAGIIRTPRARTCTCERGRAVARRALHPPKVIFLNSGSP